MKISQAQLAFASEHRFEQMDAEIAKKSQEGIRLTWQRPRFADQGGVSGILVDRVSISHHQRVDTQSNYSTDVQSKSFVTSTDPNAFLEFEQRETMEKIVGGIIDKKVTIKQIQRNRDFQVGNGQAEAINGSMQESNIQVSQNQTRSGVLGSLQVSQLALSHTQIHFEQETAQFSSRGQVTTQDGRVIDFSLDMSLERSFLSRTEEQMLIHRWQEEINLTDPLVISLDGKAPLLSDAVFEFDLDNDGEMDNINFAGVGSGFLALDRNSDNVINNGSELFGPGTGNGFNELSVFDEDQNHWIDENDAVFSQLSVWTKDENGQDRLISLKDAGIGAIALDYADTQFNMTGSDNQLNGQLRQSGIFLFENGKVGSVHQIDLVSHDIIESVPESKQPEIEPTLDMTLTQPVQAPNPLQDLLDRIEELKERMTTLLEIKNPLFEHKSRTGHGRSLYQRFRIDSSAIFSHASGSGRRQRWYG